MNETLNTILKRRSTRQYTTEEVKQEDLDLILEAAVNSPSAMNSQPWHFTVVNDQAILQEISDAAKEVGKNHPDKQMQAMANNPHLHLFYKAPVAILISCKDDAPEGLLSCAAATENILLAAESLGLGSCWVQFVELLFATKNPIADSILKKLAIPEGYSFNHAVVLGHKLSDTTPPKKLKSETITYIKK